ncbi:MAG: substrate-binding domain-containing protein [Candidatus Thiodiazotropha sp.]
MHGFLHLAQIELAILGYTDLSHTSETETSHNTHACMLDFQYLLKNSPIPLDQPSFCRRRSRSSARRISSLTDRGRRWFFGFLMLALSTLFYQPRAYADETYRIAIVPKIVGIDYYDAAKRGIDEADRELDAVEVTWIGPTQDLVDDQIEIIKDLIPSKPDLIAVAANDPLRLVPVLKEAKAAGIRIMSWDGDTNYREFFVNLVDYNQFGKQIVEAMVEQVGSEADIAIVTTTFSAPNQVRWIKAIKNEIYESYPDLRILDIRPATESRERSYRIGQAYLQEFASLKGIIALGAPNVPGVVNAVEDAGLAGQIAVVGNATPNLTRDFLKRGHMQKVFLWNAPDHGYLTVYSAYRLLTEELKPGKAFDAGRLGRMTPTSDDTSMQVALPVLVFTKDNVDLYDF